MLFQSVFTWSGPLMDAVDWMVVSSGEWVTEWMSEGALQSFTGDALFGGVGSFLVFVPQIFVLTFLISLLEDSATWLGWLSLSPPFTVVWTLWEKCCTSFVWTRLRNSCDLCCSERSSLPRRDF